MQALIQLSRSSASYLSWLGNYAFASDADTTPTGDLDCDGMNNLREFALGLNPTSGSSTDPITQQLDNTRGVFKYTRTKDSGLTYKVYVSTNLSEWILADSATQTPAAAVAGVETVTVTINGAAPPDGKLFVRVEAAQTPDLIGNSRKAHPRRNNPLSIKYTPWSALSPEHLKTGTNTIAPNSMSPTISPHKRPTARWIVSLRVRFGITHLTA